jgi:hypothetical protein
MGSTGSAPFGQFTGNFASAWASRAPNSGKEMIRIRRVFEVEAFAASDPTGELRANGERRCKQAASNRA